MTRNFIHVWDSPQNSAHCPRYSPGSSAWNHMLVVLPGTTSILPASLGIQKLWITSSEVRSTTTALPTGT